MARQCDFSIDRTSHLDGFIVHFTSSKAQEDLRDGLSFPQSFYCFLLGYNVSFCFSQVGWVGCGPLGFREEG